MKKKTMKIAMVAVVAAVAGTVTYQNQTKEVVMSELALANVEWHKMREVLRKFLVFMKRIAHVITK